MCNKYCTLNIHLQQDFFLSYPSSHRMVYAIGINILLSGSIESNIIFLNSACSDTIADTSYVYKPFWTAKAWISAVITDRYS